MPITTNGLLRYWNAKDGVKAGNTLANLAPGQPAQNLVITGGTPNAGGYIVLDGVDDTITISDTTPLKRTGPWTVEFIHYLTSDPTGYNELFGGDSYVDYSPGSMYFEYYLNAAAAYEYSTFYNADFGTVGKILHWIVTYDGTNLTAYINGVTATGTKVIGANQSFAGTVEGKTTFNSEIYSQPFPSRWHAFRYYNRALTAEERTANFSNGTEIGLSTAPTPVRIGVWKAWDGTQIPVYSITGFENEPLRVFTIDGKGFIPLVSPTDINASKVRMSTPTGIKALKK